MKHQIIFSRRHPDYSYSYESWRHCRDAYCGGHSYIAGALIRHVSESEQEYAERLARAYYLNYPRAIARRITQYALAVEPARHGANPDLVEDWDRAGHRTNEIMRQVSTMLNVFGKAVLAVEAPNFTGHPTLNDARASRLRPYVRAVSPLDLTDWAYAPDGKLLWAVIRENDTFDNPDPWGEARHCERCRLYERNRWTLFSRDFEGKTAVVSGVNHLGEVPLVILREPDGFDRRSPHWFEDAVRISEAILNNESEAQMNIVKQMFGLLVISEAFARGARRQAEQQRGGFSAILSRSAAVIEAVDEKGISRYISPTGVATETILQENTHLKEELFEITGLGFRNRHYSAQSAESKEWDFRNAGQFLAERADLLEQAERSAWRLMHGFDASIPVPEVTYNRKFAVRELAQSISGLLQLSGIDAGEAYRRQIARTAGDLLNAISDRGE